MSSRVDAFPEEENDDDLCDRLEQKEKRKPGNFEANIFFFETIFCAARLADAATNDAIFFRLAFEFSHSRYLAIVVVAVRH